MLLVNLHPAEPERRRVRARRARMTPDQRVTMRKSEADRQKQRRTDQPKEVRAAEVARYQGNGDRRAQCIAAAWRHRLRGYGLTPETYEALVVAQGNKCACCDTSEPGRGDARWCVDHDHVTGLVRGLLCHRCNTAIGLLGDNVEGARRAVTYLERGPVLP